MARNSHILRWVGLMSGTFAAASWAQMHHVDKVERVTRAVGVYEWTGDLAKPHAARFVPVSLFIDGHFEDAGLYLARPVPFALGDGYLYTVEHSGEPEGVLDLQSAARVVTGNALADDNPTGAWYGFGKFTAESAPTPPPALRRSAHVGVIQSSGKATPPAPGEIAEDDGKPHMSRRSPAWPDSADTGKTDANRGSSGQNSDTPRPGSTGGDDTDRPTLARRDPTKDASRRKPAVGGNRANTASVTAVGPQPGDDPDRPTLSRKTEADDGPQQLTGMPADLHQAVAVSDAVSRDPHPFARAWSDSKERTAVLKSMTDLAKPRVAAYLAENRLLPSTEVLSPDSAAPGTSSKEGIAADTDTGSGAPPKLQRGRPTEYNGAAASAKAAPSGASAKKAPSTPHAAAQKGTGLRRSSTPAARPEAVPLSLQHEEISGFTLSYGGLPTFVYSASVPVAPADGKSNGPAHLTVFVTVVAQRLPSGELQVALASVTDSQHLDRSPRLRLVDAVDPDASHRASLLFELRETNSRQFALYRLVTARAENTFTSAAKE